MINLKTVHLSFDQFEYMKSILVRKHYIENISWHALLKKSHNKRVTYSQSQIPCVEVGASSFGNNWHFSLLKSMVHVSRMLNFTPSYKKYYESSL